MLMNTDVRNELREIVVAIEAAGPSVSQTPQIAALFRTFDEIPKLRDALLAQLQGVLNAIDGGAPPQLAGVPNLSVHVLKAIHELEAAGGPPGVGDNVRR